MPNLRNTIAIIACKSLIKLGKLMGKKGSSMHGSIAMKISPSLLKTLANQVKKEIILVCGTNGKTTTNNLIYTLLSNDGSKVVCNNVGANMLPGVACAFVSEATLSGKLNADYAAIECDEASVRHIVNHVTPDKIVITNLFRDQMDRYGEIESTARLLDEAIQKVPDVTLVLNADDPFCASLGVDRNAIYYGVSEDANSEDDAKENQFCLKCGSNLTYEYHHYSQLGKYKCEGCSFARPNPDYSATRVDLSQGIRFVMSYKGCQHKFDVTDFLNFGYSHGDGKIFLRLTAVDIDDIVHRHRLARRGFVSLQSVAREHNMLLIQPQRCRLVSAGSQTAALSIFHDPDG